MRVRRHGVIYLTQDRDNLQVVRIRALKFQVVHRAVILWLSGDCLSNQDSASSSCLVSYVVEYG